MKIELKHLAPYLPYGLKIRLGDGEIKEVNGIRDWIGWSVVYKSKYGETNIGLSAARPILRPLSDITKVIEHNGKSFFPVQELDDCHDFSHMNFQDILVNPLRYPYTIVEKLFEWHFDVFGLIEQGLAIDINTLKP